MTTVAPASASVTMAFGELAVRVGIALALNALVLVTALLAVRRMGLADLVTRAFRVGVVAAALVAFPMLALGALGALTLRMLFGVQALLAVLALVVEIFARRRHAEASAAPAAQVPRSRAATAWDRAAVWGIALATAAYGAERLVQALADPPLQWDSLYYHLPLAVEWMQTGTLAPLYHPFAPHHGYFPGTGELFSLWAMLPFHNDLAVGLVNFFFLALGALALVRIARAVGLRASTARWIVPLYLLTPAVARVAASAYVEPALNAFLFCAAAALLDFRRERRAGDLAIFFACLALAVGTKATALGYSAVLCGALLVVWFDRGGACEGSALRRRLLAVGCGLAMLALGSYWYARNAALTGNPLYPNEVRVLGATLFEGVAKTHGGRALDAGYTMLDGLADAAASGELTAGIIGTHSNAAFELGLGPKIIVVALAFLAAIVWRVRVRRRRPREQKGEGRGLDVLFVVAALWLLLVLVTPLWHAGWLAGNIRFAAPWMGLALVLALALADSANLRAVAIALIAVAASLPDLLAPLLDLGETPRLVWALGVVFATVGGIAFGRAREATVALDAAPPPPDADDERRVPRAARAVLWVVAIGAACAALPFACHGLHTSRESGRHTAYTARWDLHETLAPAFASAWSHLDRHAQGGDVVAQSGFEYLYPLYGPRLARRVRYVDINRRDGGAHHAYPLGAHRADADPEAWIANLRRAGARWLAVGRPWHSGFPVEATWADTRPDVFVPTHRSKAARVWAIRARKDAAP